MLVHICRELAALGDGEGYVPNASGACGHMLVLIAAVVVVCVAHEAWTVFDSKRRYAAWSKKKDGLHTHAMAEGWRSWLAEGKALLTICEKRNRWSGGPFYARKAALINEIKDDLRTYGAAHAAASCRVDAAESESDTIRELARLRGEGLISNDEFAALTERFRVSTGTKAREIIDAIEQLHHQRRSGAMTEGNYHASLWTLMDRLDAETGR